MKKVLSLVVIFMLVCLLSGCAGARDRITVISREDGSGTRDAFVEIFDIRQQGNNGEEWDATVLTADITNSTGVMLQSVSQNKSAIGYVSMGSLTDSVKAIKIDSSEPTKENVRDGKYIAARAFNIAVMPDIDELTQDFIGFILSAHGQQIVEENGYVAVSNKEDYNSSKLDGKITVSGSSSVSPVMEKLIEAYASVNPNAQIELQTSDSTTGANSVMQGISDIGMLSRKLKDGEQASGLTSVVIAKDGIAVIVNCDNPIEELTSEQVRKIFMGEVTLWSEIE